MRSELSDVVESQVRVILIRSDVGKVLMSILTSRFIEVQQATARLLLLIQCSGYVILDFSGGFE